MRLLKKSAIALSVAGVLLVGLIVVARVVTSEVKVERTFDAPVTQVWKLWTDEAAMKQWWSPKDFTAPVIRNDVKPGGRFHYSMRSPKGEMFWNVGTYSEVIPGKKLVAAMSFSDELGNVIPGNHPFDYETFCEDGMGAAVG